jgi:hypothetical protein
MRAESGFGRGAKERARRWFVWQSIAALELQLLVTAGHFHADHFRFRAGQSVATALAGGPGSGQPGALSHDDCALSFGLHLANSAAPPDIAPVAASLDELRLPRVPPRRTACPYLLFRTRAPPVL